MPVEDQISRSVKNNWSYIKNFNTSSSNPDSYSDAHDGEILKKILEQYKDLDVNILSLCLNIDGANRFNSNTLSLWPIQLSQNYLLPEIRFQTHNIIVAGLYYGDVKLNCRDYLMPLVEEFIYLKKNEIKLNIQNEDYSFKPIITHCAVDLPAKSMLQETKQYGGYFGCTFCENPGELVSIQKPKDKKNAKKSNENQAKNNEGNKPREFVRYVEGSETHEMRNEVETLKKMLAASKSTETLDGIKVDTTHISVKETFLKMVSVNSNLEISLDSTFGSVADFQDYHVQLALQENEKHHGKKDFIDKIINCYLRHNLTLTCLEDFIKILNERPEDFQQLPTAKKQIIKLFREHRALFDIFYFITCDKCRVDTKIDFESKNNAKCTHCDSDLKTTETNFFIYMPIEQQIIQSVKDNWSYIKTFDTSGSADEKSYSDVHDGKILKDLLKQYSDFNVNILSLCVNTDGANKFQSNLLSVWPIQLIQNYLPPNIRFHPNNLIVAGLYYHKDKPNCHKYFRPLIDELKCFKKHNISIDIENENYIFKPVITHCSVDLPAKHLLQETKQYGGYNACSYCEIHGELIEIEVKTSKNIKTSNTAKNKLTTNQNQQNTEEKKKPKKFVRYVESTNPCKLREESKTLETMLSVATSSNKEAVDGVKGLSCLVGLEHFNILFSLSIEYMHSALLGATKRQLNLFCNSKHNGKAFYIAPKRRQILNRRLLALKPTSDIVRKPRSLDQRRNFKASEFRYMLLYYLPVCLPGCVPDIYVQHIRLLSAAIYMLLKNKIPYEEVDSAERMLERFVKEHQQLFGKEHMVMVIHLLKHFPESVRMLGPLWSHSAFPFERNNGCLLKKVNGTTDVLHQISTKYVLFKSLTKDPKLNKNVDSEKKIFQGKCVDIMENCLKAFRTDTFETLDFSNNTLRAFKRIKLGIIIFTSLLYTRPKKTINYFIGLKNEIIGVAKFYFELCGGIFVMIEEYELIDTIYHISKVLKTNRIVMAPITDIQQKYIFMKVGINQYIVSPPNSYEDE